MIQKPNLLPPAYVPPPPVNWVRVGLITFAAVVMTVALVLGISFVREVNVLTAEKAKAQQTLQELLPTKNRIDKFTELQTEIKVLENKVKIQEGQVRPLSVILADLTRVVPEGLTFGNIEYGGSTISIVGTANNPRTATAYAIELRKFKWFSEVEINTVAVVDSKGMETFGFTLTAVIREEGGQDDVQEATEPKPAT